MKAETIDDVREHCPRCDTRLIVSDTQDLLTGEEGFRARCPGENCDYDDSTLTELLEA